LIFFLQIINIKMSKEIKIQETNNKNTSLLADTYPECICSNCLCGKGVATYVEVELLH
jgi:hypothetical protein